MDGHTIVIHTENFVGNGRVQFAQTRRPFSMLQSEGKNEQPKQT